jgi:Bcr/CflA subfamily drug resistance transporter
MTQELIKKIQAPALWLITIIAGLPLLSETVYTPSLPAIAKSLAVSESWVEYTLTIYLVGFTLGVLLWGRLSDKHGRRPYIIGGFLLYALASYGCFCATTITQLMFCRFFQAFGASVGSVVSQAIVRDVFIGKELSKVYAIVGSALALFPAIGPVIGGWIAQHYGWSSIFLFLCTFGLIITSLAFLQLPETHHKENRNNVAISEVALKMICDKSVIGYGLLVAACNGILFSYFAEGPFFLMNILGLSAQTYGLTFIAIAGATMFGGWLAKHLHTSHTSFDILRYGIFSITAGATFFSITIVAYTLGIPLSPICIITATIISMMLSGIGSCMVTSNALSGALINYRYASGAASSLFGFSYYAVTSLFTYIMGLLHNGTLIPMPLYFLCIALSMIVVFNKMVKAE